jgi:ABC-type glycerol-3-phosphate transport system substrate-binding protein
MKFKRFLAIGVIGGTLAACSSGPATNAKPPTIPPTTVTPTTESNN